MVISTHYQVILNELRDRFVQASDNPDALQQEVAEQTRQRFISFLEADQTLSLAEVIGQLERKWRADGLLVRPQERF
jgi:hypothetical protein